MSNLESKKDGYYKGRDVADDISTKILKSEEDVQQFLKEEQLDYTVKKYQEKSPFDGSLLDSYGSYRTDNNHIFKTGLGKTYTPFQNKDAFNAISGLAQVGEVHTARAGVWNGGAESFIQVDLNGGLTVGRKEDKVQQRVTYINRHDGEGSARIFITPFRPVCRNQLTLIRSIAKKAEQKLKVRHTASGEALLLKLSEQWGIIDNAFVASQEHFNLLADTKVTKEHVAEVLQRISPVLDLKFQSKRLHDANEKKQLGISQFVSDADNGFIAFDTAWNLINAITRYNTHEQTGFSNKEKSLLVGSGRDANYDALDIVNDVCDLAVA